MLKDTKLSTSMKKEAHSQNISKHNMEPLEKEIIDETQFSGNTAYSTYFKKMTFPNL